MIDKKPSIRFKGHTNTWELCKLDDMSVLITKQTGFDYSATIKPSLLTEKDEDTYSFIQNKDFDGENINLDTDFYIPIEVAERFPKIILDTPSLLISISGKIGNVGYYRLKNKAFIGGAVGICKLKEDNGSIIVHALQSSAGQAYFHSLTKASSHSNITVEDIRNIEILLPSSKVEEKRITEFFKHLNNLITLHQRKYDMLINVKKTMMQKMFSPNGEDVPEIRFKGFKDKWKQCKLKELVVIERGGSPRPIEDFITNSDDGLNWIKIGDAPTQGNYIIKTKEKIRPEGLSKTREVHPGDLILSNSMSFGRPYIMGIDGCIHDGWLLIRDTNKVFDLKYLCCLLGTEQMFSQYRAMAAGSTVNNLNKEVVGNTIVKYPSKGEQALIGQYMYNLDKLITLYQHKLEKLKSIKQTMLERMFI